MAKVILICGKICCGKTTYAKSLCKQYGAVLLSIDEITLSLFGQHCGDKHDDYVERTENYLFHKSLELLDADVTVVLDWGFWKKDERDYARHYYSSRSIECEFHYIDTDEETRKLRLQKRNAAVTADPTLAYYVDENLAAKFASIFDPPKENEIDVWLKQ